MFIMETYKQTKVMLNVYFEIRMQYAICMPTVYGEREGGVILRLENVLKLL